MADMTLRYNCVALAGVNRPAEYKRDENGYYYVLLAALNVYNSDNIFYLYNESKHVFERSNIFMRKMASGKLWGERDHPPYVPGMSEAEGVDRNEWIEITNTAMHIRDIDVIPTEEMVDGLPVVEIWGWINPDGCEHGDKLKVALDNPDMNVCFSLRAVVREGIINGRKCRRIDRLVTVDWVIEDGLKICNKYSAMTRGSKVAQESTRTLLDRPVNLRELERILTDEKATSSVATESARTRVREHARDYLGYAGTVKQLNVQGLGARSW